MKIEKFLSQSYIFALYQAQRSVLEAFQARLAAYDVHLLQGLILTSIFFEEREVRPLELAEAFAAERSNLSHSLRALEKKGLIKRSLHFSDARGYLFALTPAGRRKAIALVKEFDLVQEAHEASFGAKKSRELVESLQKVTLDYKSKFKLP